MSEKESDHTPLCMASAEQLFEEISRRCPAAVLVAEFVPERDAGDVYRSFQHGCMHSRIGLLSCALSEVDETVRVLYRKHLHDGGGSGESV